MTWALTVSGAWSLVASKTVSLHSGSSASVVFAAVTAVIGTCLSSAKACFNFKAMGQQAVAKGLAGCVLVLLLLGIFAGVTGIIASASKAHSVTHASAALAAAGAAAALTVLVIGSAQGKV